MSNAASTTLTRTGTTWKGGGEGYATNFSSWSDSKNTWYNSGLTAVAGQADHGQRDSHAMEGYTFDTIEGFQGPGKSAQPNPMFMDMEQFL